jgi:hypothetical protein
MEGLGVTGAHLGSDWYAEARVLLASVDLFVGLLLIINL